MILDQKLPKLLNLWIQPLYNIFKYLETNLIAIGTFLMQQEQYWILSNELTYFNLCNYL